MENCVRYVAVFLFTKSKAFAPDLPAVLDAKTAPPKTIICAHTDRRLAREQYRPNCNKDGIACTSIAAICPQVGAANHKSRCMRWAKPYLDAPFAILGRNLACNTQWKWFALIIAKLQQQQQTHLPFW